MAWRGKTSSIRIGGAVLAAALALPAIAIAQAQQFAIPRDKADCLINIAELDARLTTDPVILKLDDCPDIVASVDTFRPTQLAASPGSPTPRVGAGLPILILTRREIACLMDQIRADRDRAGGSDPVQIDLARCPAS